jgi:glycosyltransferase involved in cell wall biosynthesis
MTRVGQFLAHYPSPGGTASVLRGLSAGLVELGHEVVVYGYGSATEVPPGETYDRIFPMPRTRLRGLGGAFRSDELTRALAANEDGLDILIIHGMFSPLSRRIHRAAREGGVHTIAQPHDPYCPALFVERRLAKSLYWRLFERPFLRSVDAIQVYAPSHRGHLVRLGVDTPVLVVPGGISPTSLERAAEARRRSARSADETLKVLFVGRFDIYNKGIDLMLEAAASLRPNIEIDCVGAANRADLVAVERVVHRLGLTRCVHLVDRTDDPWTAFAQADVFVLPSRFDGFGLVVLEALAAGTPVVLSNAAGAAEYVGDDDAVIVADPSVEGLHGALLDAVERKAELRAAAADAPARIEQRFGWRACAEQWFQEANELHLVSARQAEAPMESAR